MAQVSIEEQTLRALLQQARVAPPRNLEARFAIDDTEDMLNRQRPPAEVPGQLRLFDPQNL